MKPQIASDAAADFTFWAERVMWGSDWPVCRRRDEYGDWRGDAMEQTGTLGDAEADAIYGQTACRCYDLAL